MDIAIRPAPIRTRQWAPTRVHALALLANGLALIALIVGLSAMQPQVLVMRVGEVAGDTVVAQRQVTYEDRVATAAKRRQAMTAIPAVYRPDVSKAALRRKQAATFFAEAAPIVARKEPVAKKLAQVRRLVPTGVSSTALQEFPNLTPDQFRIVQQHSLLLLSQAQSWRFDDNQIPTTEIALLGTLPAQLTARERTAIGETLATFLTATLVPDLPATVAKQHEAATKVAPVMGTVYRGEVVVRRGDLVTPTVMEKLTALGLQTRQVGWQEIAASALFTILVVTTFFWYLRAFQAPLLANARLLLLFDASILAAVGGAHLLASGHILLPYFLPVAAASTFAAALVAPEACLALTMVMAVLAGWVVANSFEQTIYYFLTGAAGVLAMRQVRQLRQFILAGFYIALFAFITLLAFGFIDRSYDLAAIQEYAFAALFNGFSSAALALGGVAILSSFFGVTTTLQLLELGQPTHPLLRRLMVKAPGTYNHSLLLATMVERAAQEIGAQALVAKVGALYHDVGKTTNPHCFVENQLGISNIHDDLEPEESARIIRGHVSQGLKLARQFKLPRVILDAIAEHHGTTVISYFLHRAEQESGDMWIDRSLYTYPGPKPQTKETALLMLADGCEAAVRAARDHSGEAIQNIVRNVFRERVETGQLDESPLTLRDLELTRIAFCAVLNGLYHPRIEYPEPAEPIPARRVEHLRDEARTVERR